MRLRTLCGCVLAVGLVFSASVGLHAQGAVEYGIMTGNAAGAAAGGGRAAIPFPNITLPGVPSNSGGGAAPASGPAGVAAGTAESAAKSNVQFFQANAGANAGTIAVHTVPETASVWLDGKYLGSAPIATLKLAPGHHQLLVRAPNMQETTRAFDLTAKQAQTLDIALKSSYQSQVTMHWPSQSKTQSQAQPK